MDKNGVNLKYKENGYRSIIIYDIDVMPGIDTVNFDLKSYNRLLNINIRNVKKCFPDVTTIVLPKNTYEINISNTMFPNVRNVISNSDYFDSGKYIVNKKRSYKGKVLLNAFCCRRDEVVDLTDIAIIENYAFEGCLSTNFINTESVKEISEKAFTGAAVKYKNTDIVNIGNIIALIDSDFNVIDIPNETVAICVLNKDIQNIGQLIVHSFNMLVKLAGSLGPISIDEIYVDDDYEISVEKLLEYFQWYSVKKIGISPKNKKYVSIDGMVYTKDKEILVFCPSNKEKDAIIQDGTKYINREAFRFTKKLDSIVIPDSVLHIDKRAFSWSSISQIKIGKGVSVINGDGIFKTCPNLRNIEIPENIISLEGNIFGDKLENVIFHEGLRYIGDNVFKENKIKEVTLPFSLDYIGNYNFLSAQKIVISGNTKHLGNALFMVSQSSISQDLINTYKTLVIDNKEVYIPSVLDKETFNFVADALDYNTSVLFTDDFAGRMINAAKTTEIKQDIALLYYIKNNNESVKAYLRRSGYNIAERYIRTDKEKELVKLLNCNLLTLNALKKAQSLAEKLDRLTMVSYIMSKINAESKKKAPLFKL